MKDAHIVIIHAGALCPLLLVEELCQLRHNHPVREVVLQVNGLRELPLQAGF